jgi:RNA polymerase sigma-70 factor (ECF subfamily)
VSLTFSRAMTRIQIEEVALLKLLRARDRKGFSILYDNYSAALFGIIKRIVNDSETAEDVLQDAFVKIWNNFDRYDESKGRLFTWMVNICRNSAIDKVRSAGYIHENKNRLPADIVTYDGGSVNMNVDTIDLKKIVSALDTEYQQVITLLYFGGYSQSETAEILKIPLGTVKTRSRTAIQKLKEYFNSNEH